MRTLIFTTLIALGLSAAAQAQTASIISPTNQDPSATPAEQSMQPIGGPSNSIAVNVQGKVRPASAAPRARFAHHLRTTTKTKRSPKAR